MTRGVLILVGVVLSFTVSAGLEKNSFFKWISSGTAEQVKTGRASIEKLTQTAEIRAYLGAIIMKEAEFQSTPKAKLEVFKKGRNLLEAEIKKSPSSAEYRFLRLMIQENCPKILGYNTQIESDAAFVAKNYATLPEAVKSAVSNYAKKSKALASKKLVL